MNALVALLGGWRATAFAALAALLLVVLVVVLGLHRLTKAQLAGCKAMSTTYQSTQEANGRTIDGLRANLSAAIKRNEADQKRAEEAGTAAEKRRNAIQAELAETQEALAHAYAKSQTARAWGTVGVDRDIADRLPRPR